MAYCYLKKCFTGFVILMLMLVKTGYAAMQDTTGRGSTHPGWVSGVVLDEYANPLNGVKVMIKGKTDASFTDKDGRFEINAVTGDKLVFTMLNYYTSEVNISSKSPVTIKLLDTYLKAPETINVLYGTKKAAANLGSVASIYTNQLTTTPASLYTHALPGQLPGLYTQQYSGFASPQTSTQTVADFIGNVVQHNNYSANDNTEIGLSLRGQTPITVIDGVQREISSIDPESIESVSVLKDALSNILLGINSSRGVLLITTKHGQAGAPRISFTAEVGSQHPLDLPKPLPAYQYAYLYNEALQNDGKPTIYTADDFNAYRNHTDPAHHPDVNWFNTLLRNSSPISSYKLNVNGGSSVAQYSVSLNYMDQQGMFKTSPAATYNTNNELSRYIINSDLSVNVTKKFTVDLQLFGRIQQATQPGTGYSGILNTLYNTPNNAYPVYNPNGSFGGTTLFTNNLLSQSQFSGYQRTNSNDVMANLDLNYDLSSVTKGLSVKLKGNLAFESQGLVNRSLQNNTYLLNKDSSYSAVGTPISQSNGFATVSSARYSFAQAALNYERQFGKGTVSGMLLYDTRSVVLNYDLSGVTTNRAAKLGYNYDGKYFIEASANSSGYNRYPPGNQYGMFYAVGLGWQMGQEGFIKDISWISSWKWRATYGKTGNANVDNFGYYNFLQTYGTSIGYPYTLGTARSVIQSYNENTLANPYIRWENAKKLDIGTDISLFKDHFKITADYFHDRYYDLLQTRGNSIALLGTTYSAENIGVKLYKGTELTLTYQDHAGNLNYFITANATRQTSTNVFSDEEPAPYPWLRRTGLSNDVIFGYTALGFFKNAQDAATSATTVGYTPQAGDVKYKDLNGDHVINQFDQSAIANTKPLIYYGLSFGVNYKGFSVSVIMQGVTNHQIIYNNNLVNGFAGLGQFGNIYLGQGYDALTGRWTPETANIATLPRLSSTGNVNNGLLSTLYIRSANYMRLKNAEVGYSLPLEWARKLRLSGIRVFANGENLYTFYGYKGVDPEVYGLAYPIQRVFNAGINIKL